MKTCLMFSCYLPNIKCENGANKKTEKYGVLSGVHRMN